MPPPPATYDTILHDISQWLDAARRTAARSVNAIMTATYWMIGRRIVEYEQDGQTRATYGKALLAQLSDDLTARYGRGFSVDNLENMRRFYLAYPVATISETASRNSTAPETQALFLPLSTSSLQERFPLPWSHYVRLMAIDNPEARTYYEEEALRGGWSVRQLRRQIDSRTYERVLLSRNKASMLRRATRSRPEDAVSPEEEIKDPFVLEFLDLKDEYSETDLEEALIRHLEAFLLELGNDFAFIGRQRRLRIGNAWYRIDLLLFHRRLRSLVVVDLKLGEFTHADAGQMHLYLNYAREHWTHPDENPPVGLILCAAKDAMVAKYALEGLPNTVMAAEYQMVLPDEEMLLAELERTRKLLEPQLPDE